jgi:hypothetical protein
MSTGPVDDLFPNIRNPEGTLIINDRCLVKTQGDQRAVIVCGVVMAQYKLSDDMAEAQPWSTWLSKAGLIRMTWPARLAVARAP